MRAGKPRGPTLVSIFMHAFIVARVSRVRDKSRRPYTDIPDQLQRRRDLRMLGQHRWPGLSRRGAVYPRENRTATRRCRAIGYLNSTSAHLQLRPGRAVDMRSPHTEPRREVWGSGALSIPRSAHICVQESRPHTVRDPVTARGRDLRIRARAWAGARSEPRYS